MNCFNISSLCSVEACISKKNTVWTFWKNLQHQNISFGEYLIVLEPRYPTCKHHQDLWHTSDLLFEGSSIYIKGLEDTHIRRGLLHVHAYMYTHVRACIHVSTISSIRGSPASKISIRNYKRICSQIHSPQSGIRDLHQEISSIRDLNQIMLRDLQYVSEILLSTVVHTWENLQYGGLWKQQFNRRKCVPLFVCGRYLFAVAL